MNSLLILMVLVIAFFFICPHPLLFMVKSFNLFFIIKNVFDNYICTKCLKNKQKTKINYFSINFAKFNHSNF